MTPFAPSDRAYINFVGEVDPAGVRSA
jgi:hypothetical protein